jgi:hypothetical protein
VVIDGEAGDMRQSVDDNSASFTLAGGPEVPAKRGAFSEVEVGSEAKGTNSGSA